MLVLKINISFVLWSYNFHFAKRNDDRLYAIITNIIIYFRIKHSMTSTPSLNEYVLCNDWNDNIFVKFSLRLVWEKELLMRAIFIILANLTPFRYKMHWPGHCSLHRNWIYIGELWLEEQRCAALYSRFHSEFLFSFCGHSICLIISSYFDFVVCIRFNTHSLHNRTVPFCSHISTVFSVQLVVLNSGRRMELHCRHSKQWWNDEIELSTLREWAHCCSSAIYPKSSIPIRIR